MFAVIAGSKVGVQVNSGSLISWINTFNKKNLKSLSHQEEEDHMINL